MPLKIRNNFENIIFCRLSGKSHTFIVDLYKIIILIILMQVLKSKKSEVRTFY